MTCDDAEVLLAANAIGSLDHGDQGVLRLHLEGCCDCRAAGGVYLHVGAILAEAMVPPVTPPLRLRTSLMAQVTGEARARSSAGPVACGSRWYRRLWLRIPAGRPFILAGGVLAAAASLLAAWSFAGARPNGSLAVRLSTCGSAGASATRCALDYDPAAHQAALTMHSLTFPAVFGASSAQIYEVWLMPAGGAPLPAAFLTEAPVGGEWSAVVSADLDRYVAVVVTAEPQVGSPAPTGPEVLRVRLPARD